MQQICGKQILCLMELQYGIGAAETGIFKGYCLCVRDDDYISPGTDDTQTEFDIFAIHEEVVMQDSEFFNGGPTQKHHRPGRVGSAKRTERHGFVRGVASNR